MNDQTKTTEETLEALRLAEQKYRSIFEHCLERHIPNYTRRKIHQCKSRHRADVRLSVCRRADCGSHRHYSPTLRSAWARSEFIQLVRDNGKVIDFESQIYRRDRNVIWISENARVVRDEVSGEVLYYEGMVQDITRRKAAEEERDQANARLSVQYAVARTLAEVRHLGEASNKIVQAICESVGWDFGDMWRIDPEANLLRCVDIWHAPEFRAHEFIEAT